MKPSIYMRIPVVKTEDKEKIRMKAETKFEKMYFKLPKKARSELVYNFAVNPMTLKVCWLEINMNTKLGKEILKELGYEDD